MSGDSESKSIIVQIYNIMEVPPQFSYLIMPGSLGIQTQSELRLIQLLDCLHIAMGMWNGEVNRDHTVEYVLITQNAAC